ncbi:hypothetical protein LPJ78_002883 [Coemansia sp. RSA 989]|nr:hypothetical protein BX667DRAFT_345982 [Coemansia mojavensis]KAJ1742250.1 hypothetical protein LPJ68_002106 [Coemansia sp. RSA 1086]KAJ1750597.1 hypothetical protein LPJ79_002795 [Coemansia sp. RSA 1821]KAJ1865188.1 hypothetical protein LPJ78_002883 [Coemansia sp. RSA 989]KAJ1872517.1 hypothetical protein LPJ55_003054 [Coemansia sp. RSA 990]KAJ2629934.1 hypothetical protein H4R22_003030 [Coemansia sp. RSA 1290]KAJ2653539.1 hypothetical protein IWW40_000233 [Coemansia sp. RSA 1250]KAJ26772
MALNAVMLELGTRHPVPLPDENFLYHNSGVKLELKSGDGYPGDAISFTSSSGTAFISNQRIVYLPVTTTHENSMDNSVPSVVNSFTVPHTNLKDIRFVSPIFNSNRFEAIVTPVDGGNIPSHAKLMLSFKEGGCFDFTTIARKMSERIQETGTIPPFEEALPAYDAPVQGPPDHSQDVPPAYPDEAPPVYEHHATGR